MDPAALLIYFLDVALARALDVFFSISLSASPADKMTPAALSTWSQAEIILQRTSFDLARDGRPL